MKRTSNGFAIGTLAGAAGVNVETIRFYQRKGLLSEPVRPYGSIRRYTNAAVGRVRFIKASQRLGFSLGEVGELLKLEDGTRCGEARTLPSTSFRMYARNLPICSALRPHCANS